MISIRQLSMQGNIDLAVQILPLGQSVYLDNAQKLTGLLLEL